MAGGIRIDHITVQFFVGMDHAADLFQDLRSEQRIFRDAEIAAEPDISHIRRPVEAAPRDPVRPSADEIVLFQRDLPRLLLFSCVVGLSGSVLLIPGKAGHDGRILLDRQFMKPFHIIGAGYVIRIHKSKILAFRTVKRIIPCRAHPAVLYVKDLDSAVLSRIPVTDRRRSVG